MFKKTFWAKGPQPLLCKLFEHCALAQRSEAPEPCSESQSRLKIMIFRMFLIFIISRCLMIISSPPEKWYLKYFNLNETLHVPRLDISPAGN